MIVDSEKFDQLTNKMEEFAFQQQSLFDERRALQEQNLILRDGVTGLQDQLKSCRYGKVSGFMEGLSFIAMFYAIGFGAYLFIRGLSRLH